MWKLIILIALTVAPGTPIHPIRSYTLDKPFKDEASCKQFEASKDYLQSIEKMGRELEKKLGVPGVIIMSKCTDTSKKDTPVPDNVI